MSEEKVGFDINEEIIVDDLDVKKDRPVLPATQNLAVKIVSAETRIDHEDPKNEESQFTYAYLNLNLEVISGIDVEGESKYKGMRFFTHRFDLGLKHNEAIKTGRWWQKKQYALGTKQFLVALGFDPKQPPKFNDEFLTSIIDRQMLCDVRQEEIQEKDQSGEYVGTGEFRNRFSGWKGL